MSIAEELGAQPDPQRSWAIGTASGDEQWLTISSFGTELRCRILHPPPRPQPAPVVVLPFYDVASPCGERSPRTRGKTATELRDGAHARMLSEHGLQVVVVPWWFEAVLDPQPPDGLAERYRRSTDRHHLISMVGTLLRSAAA